jgi:hypothetical protein
MTNHYFVHLRFIVAISLIFSGVFVCAQNKYEQKIVGEWQLISIEKDKSSHNLSDKNYYWNFLADGQLQQQSAEGNKTYAYKFSKDTLLVPAEGRKAVITKLGGKYMEMYMLDRSATARFQRVKKN